MADSGEHVDKPEPRWQALLALVAIGGIYLALPSSFIVGPVWLLPALIAMLLPNDYLFIAFTQSLTFGPTDAPLLARWAKLLTMCQILISLSIVVLLISRAVGIL
jgi:hypothetical protein